MRSVLRKPTRCSWSIANHGWSKPTPRSARERGPQDSTSSLGSQVNSAINQHAHKRRYYNLSESIDGCRLPESRARSIYKPLQDSCPHLATVNVLGTTSPPVEPIARPESYDDFEQCIQILGSRLRIDGPEATWDLWRLWRAHNVDLPTEGSQADKLWSSYVSTALALHKLPQLFSNALEIYNRTGSRYIKLYELCVGFFLANKPALAYTWHEKLKELNLPEPGTLGRLVDSAAGSKKGLSEFKRIYSHSGERGVYDAMIPILCNLGLYEKALNWHKYLFARLDLPSSASVADPLRQHLTVKDKKAELDNITRDLVDSGVSFEGAVPIDAAQNARITTQSIRQVVGETFGVQEKPVSDRLCARAFATTAFSLDFVMTACASFGVQAIGPASLREVLLRCSDVRDASQKLHRLKSLGIEIKKDAFTDVVLKTIAARDWRLLQDFLRSDQHPDVYDDVGVQTKLLAFYLDSLDWHQAHRTLSILTVNNPSAENGSWNFLLQRALKANEWNMVSNLHKDMVAAGTQVTLETLRVSFWAILRPRRPGNRPIVRNQPSRHGFDDLNYITDLWLNILASGGYVPPSYWNQVCNRYGMERRLDELESLSLKLASIYSTKSVALSSLAFKSPMQPVSRAGAADQLLRSDQERQFIGQLFPRKRQAAIIEWGFIAPRQSHRMYKPDSLSLESDHDGHSCKGAYENFGNYPTEPAPSFSDMGKLRGLALLRVLRDHYGLAVHDDVIRSSCRKRLRLLYGAGVSREHHNRLAKKNNRVSLAKMIEQINEFWDAKQPVFSVTSELLQESAGSSVSLRLKVLGSRSLRPTRGRRRSRVLPKMDTNSYSA